MAARTLISRYMQPEKLGIDVKWITTNTYMTTSRYPGPVRWPDVAQRYQTKLQKLYYTMQQIGSEHLNS